MKAIWATDASTESCFGYEKRQRKVKRLSSAFCLFVSLRFYTFVSLFCVSQSLFLCLTLSDIVCLFLSCYLSRCPSVSPFLYLPVHVFLTVYLHACLSLRLSGSMCLPVCLLLYPPFYAYIFVSVWPLRSLILSKALKHHCKRELLWEPFWIWFALHNGHHSTAGLPGSRSREGAPEATTGRHPSRTTKGQLIYLWSKSHLEK